MKVPGWEAWGCPGECGALGPGSRGIWSTRTLCRAGTGRVTTLLAWVGILAWPAVPGPPLSFLSLPFPKFLWAPTLLPPAWLSK